MVRITAHIPRQLQEIGELQVAARIGRRTKSVPCGAPVSADLAALAPLLEQREGRPQATPELIG
jgi:hypothetical protein